MAESSKIEWTDATFNPWIGCTKVSPGCDHCYAETMMKRTGRNVWGAGEARVRTSEKYWAEPLKWNAQRFVQCADCGYRCELRAFHPVDPEACDFTMCPRCSGHDYHGARRRVFCASLADVFDNEVPVEWRRDLFRLIAETPNLDWLLLTKRIGNALRMMDEIAWNPIGPPGNWKPMTNVWLGATVVNQEEADRDIPKLLATPARVRFLSMEPLLGPVDLTRAFRPLCDHGSVPGPHSGSGVTCPACGGFGCHRGVDWVIVGGESGPHARPAHPDWFRSLRDQCAAAGVPLFMKQMGGTRDKRGRLEDLPEDLRIRRFPQ